MPIKLKQQITSAKGLQRNSRIVIEKVEDVTFGKKFKKLINKNKISCILGVRADLQACVLSLIGSYEYYMHVDAPLEGKALAWSYEHQGLFETTIRKRLCMRLPSLVEERTGTKKALAKPDDSSIDDLRVL